MLDVEDGVVAGDEALVSFGGAGVYIFATLSRCSLVHLPEKAWAALFPLAHLAAAFAYLVEGQPIGRGVAGQLRDHGQQKVVDPSIGFAC